jgi:hypothetical protein
VHVMIHSGVCVQRQYRTFASVVHGQTTRDFFLRLVDDRYAAAYPSGHNRGVIYHVRHKALYRAIDDVNSRLRRTAFLGRSVERLMLLDAVLSCPSLRWLGTASDKMSYFSTRVGGGLRRDEYPRLIFGEGPTAGVRYFPDKLPIGVAEDGSQHVFLYLVTHPLPREFRIFLHRYAELFRALQAWTLRLLIPRHLTSAGERYRSALREELATPLSREKADELGWYFRRRVRETPLDDSSSQRYERAQRAFSAARFRVLYRVWRDAGDVVLDSARSPVLTDALARGTGAVELYFLPHRYNHLLPLVGTA